MENDLTAVSSLAGSCQISACRKQDSVHVVLDFGRACGIADEGEVAVGAHQHEGVGVEAVGLPCVAFVVGDFVGLEIRRRAANDAVDVNEGIGCLRMLGVVGDEVQEREVRAAEEIEEACRPAGRIAERGVGGTIAGLERG